MIELIQAIALMCQLSIGAMGISPTDIEKRQLECHKYYIRCLKTKGNLDTIGNLAQCIEEK